MEKERIDEDRCDHLGLGRNGGLPHIRSGRDHPAYRRELLAGAKGACLRLRRHRHVSAPRSGQRIVLIAPARRIATLPWGKKTSSLLAAPTSGNGFCTSIAGPYGGSQCVPGTSRKPTNRLHAQLTGDASGPIAITGFFFESRGTRLTVAYEDGTRDLIPIFWVSRPISAGLFAFRLPSSHRRVGHRPIKAQLFAPDGQIVSQARVPD